MREAHLRDLIAVIETGSVRSAARKLGLTQAAVSKNLTALERALGVQLLVRSAQGVELTDYGRITLRRARVVDAEMRRLQAELDSLQGGHGGDVNVGLSATAEAMLLPEALERFHEKAPGVLVSITGGRSSSTIAALRDAKIDFAVGPLPPGEEAHDLATERLFSSDLGIVVRAGHPLADCDDLGKLVGCTWLLSVRASGMPVISTLFHEHGLPGPDIVARSESPSSLVCLLLASDHVTLTSVAALKPYCERGLLKQLPIVLDLPPIVQHLMSSASRPLTAQAAALASEFRRVSRRLRR